ncbi:hypothetical protein Baya_12076 [Bagarius yarrelli]|uniref:Uncharacterized protein n=1 Tax=Bagarius yarrelli TaxID=175774 RepID=A0A556V2N2_BAGYA|nr:hypothetical protein Baya_12076 [Bagarius yarrelli]
MDSVKDVQNISLTTRFLDEPKKRKKKKAKKPKKEKSDKPKSKSQKSSKDFTDICDSKLFAEWLKNRQQEKTKRKKNPEIRLNKTFPLTQNKNLKLSRRHKQNRKCDSVSGEHGICSGPGKQEALQPITSSIRKENNQKKRVVFNLSPVLVEPEPVQHPSLVKDSLRPQRTDKKPPFNAIFSADGHHHKPAAEENSTQSQSTTDDINSQDLFITQKTFSDPYIDLCSSTSPEEAGEPQCFTETRPGTQSNTEPSAKKRVSPEPQAYTESSPRKRLCPEHQVSTTSSAKQGSSLEPGCHTASYPKHQSLSESSRKQFCTGHRSYIASLARKESSQELLSYPASSLGKQFGPENQYYTRSYQKPPASTASSPSTKPQCYTASCVDPQSLLNKPCPSPTPRKPSHCQKLDVFTQTENFFTSPFLATSLRVHQQSACTEKPVDLSLPRRSRLHQDGALGDQRHTEPIVSDSSPGNDSDSHSKSKADMSQLKTVQTRLNESFFFKLKGEGDSPKPVSPLMKFTGNAEKKKS